MQLLAAAKSAAFVPLQILFMPVNIVFCVGLFISLVFAYVRSSPVSVALKTTLCDFCSVFFYSLKV